MIKMNRKFLIIVIITTILLWGCSSSQAFFGGPPDKEGASDKAPRGEKMVERLAKELNLTKVQKDKFLSVTTEIEKTAKEIRAKDRELMDKIEKELLKDNPDMKVIRSLMQTINQNMTEIQFSRLSHLVEFRKELTTEQREKFKGLINNREKRGKKARGD
ncbi:MAG: periplasmic heavy metal sensor [bacterium]